MYPLCALVRLGLDEPLLVCLRQKSSSTAVLVSRPMGIVVLSRNDPRLSPRGIENPDNPYMTDRYRSPG